jgi:hypothetical protein
MLHSVSVLISNSYQILSNAYCVTANAKSTALTDISMYSILIFRPLQFINVNLEKESWSSMLSRDFFYRVKGSGKPCVVLSKISNSLRLPPDATALNLSSQEQPVDGIIISCRILHRLGFSASKRLPSDWFHEKKHASCGTREHLSPPYKTRGLTRGSGKLLSLK